MRKLILALCLFVTGFAKAQVASEHKADRLGSVTALPHRVNNKAKVKPGKLYIFPNPASGQVGLSIRRELREGGQLEIINQSGQKVLSRKWEGEKIDVSGLSEGNYIASVRQGDQIFSGKLVVTRSN